MVVKILVVLMWMWIFLWFFNVLWILGRRKICVVRRWFGIKKFGVVSFWLCFVWLWWMFDRLIVVCWFCWIVFMEWLWFWRFWMWIGIEFGWINSLLLIEVFLLIILFVMIVLWLVSVNVLLIVIWKGDLCVVFDEVWEMNCVVDMSLFLRYLIFLLVLELMGMIFVDLRNEFWISLCILLVIKLS